MFFVARNMSPTERSRCKLFVDDTALSIVYSICMIVTVADRYEDFQRLTECLCHQRYRTFKNTRLSGISIIRH